MNFLVRWGDVVITVFRHEQVIMSHLGRDADLEKPLHIRHEQVVIDHGLGIYRNHDAFWQDNILPVVLHTAFL